MRIEKYRYQDLIDLGYKDSLFQTPLSEAAKAELLYHYIDFMMNKGFYHQKEGFIMYYLLIYESILQQEVHYYMLEEFDKYLETLSKEISFKFNYSKRHEIIYSNKAIKFMSELEKKSIYSDGYDGTVSLLAYLYIHRINNLDKDDSYKRLIAELYVLSFHLRKNIINHKESGRVDKLLWVPKYNYAKDIK